MAAQISYGEIMTVGELIEKLKDMPMEQPVCIYDSKYGYILPMEIKPP